MVFGLRVLQRLYILELLRISNPYPGDPLCETTAQHYGATAGQQRHQPDRSATAFVFACFRTGPPQPLEWKRLPRKLLVTTGETIPSETVPKC